MFTCPKLLVINHSKIQNNGSVLPSKSPGQYTEAPTKPCRNTGLPAMALRRRSAIAGNHVFLQLAILCFYILCTHADAGFLNETNSRSRAGAHIFLSENDPFPRFNGAVLSIAQIIKFVIASAAKSELAALFVTAREMIPHRQTLIAMGWPQPKSPIQTDNSTAAGVTNKTCPAGPR